MFELEEENLFDRLLQPLIKAIFCRATNFNLKTPKTPIEEGELLPFLKLILHIFLSMYEGVDHLNFWEVYSSILVLTSG
jgi:hypothetical protein